MKKEQIFEVVKKVIMEILPDIEPEQISADKKLKDLGANSVDRMEVVTVSMEELGVKLPLMSFSQVSNIQGLIDVLAEGCN